MCGHWTTGVVTELLGGYWTNKKKKTVVWTRIDRCFFDDNENAYFRKRISADKA